MRAVWSFWSKPFFGFKGRIWREPVHHLLAWGLSLRLARQHYPDTVLVTDEAGKMLLVDRLGLRFAYVSTELERLRDVDLGWWALGKLVAYSLQDRPFVHIDTDVFLWKALPARLISAPVFTQCPEDHPLDEWCGPRDIETAFARHELLLPIEWQWVRAQPASSFREENCGIIGGNRVDFLRHYAQTAIDVVLNPAHARLWREFPEKAGYNMIVEQFLLAACLDYHRFRPDSPYRGVFARGLFGSFGESFDAGATSRAGYTHLLGDAKGNELVTTRLERRVEREDPDFFKHCVRLAQATGSA